MRTRLRSGAHGEHPADIPWSLGVLALYRTSAGQAPFPLSNESLNRDGGLIQLKNPLNFASTSQLQRSPKWKGLFSLEPLGSDSC